MIVGIGELLWDVFPDGRKVAGGAPFNFAVHCRQLGHDAAIVSRVGDDDLGRKLREEVRRLGLPDEFIQTDRDHPTGTVRVSLDTAGQPAYTITEDVAWDYIEATAQLRVLADLAEAVCYGSLAQRSEPSRSAIREFVRGTRRDGRVFDINLRAKYYSPEAIGDSFGRASWVKLNEEELRRLLSRSTYPVPDLDQLRKQVWWTTDNTTYLLTKGPAGCEVYDPRAHEPHWSEPGVPARVVDTVGAGDAFTAAMVCLHLEGRPLRECARFANHYAARVCGHRGATPHIDRAEVERACGM